MLPHSARATHIVGGDMTYKKVADGRFLITMNLRRDCFLGADNAQFDRNAKIRIFRGNGTLFAETTMPYMDDDTLNNYVQSDCGFEGTQVCVHETRYLKFIDLPFNEGGYTIAYQRCCRNGSINNIINPLETGATYSVFIPKEAFTSQNSSPSFKQWPATYICANENLSFDNSAIDPDGDSLVYKFCTPKIGLTIGQPEGWPSYPPYQDLIWQPPYNLNNLMGGDPLKIDPRTGLMTAVPILVGQYVIGVCVEEYRNGKKLGEIRRDFQYNVRVCSTPPTALFDAPSSVCNSKTVAFTNTSLSSNTYEWNFNYPSTDLAFRSIDKNPVFNFPANGDYKVYLKVIRGSDLCSDTIIKNIHITDEPYIADFEYDIKACNPDGTISVILTDKSTTNDAGAISTSWNWTLVQNGITQTNNTNPAQFVINPGDFSVDFSVIASNACSGSISRNVIYDTKILESDFKVELSGCDENNDLIIRLIDLSQSLNDNYTITEHNWKVVIGVTEKFYTGDSVVISIPRQNFTVILDINTDKFCRNTTQKEFVISDFIPSADFIFDLSGCDVANTAIIRLTEQSNDTVPYSNVSSYNWTYKNAAATGKVVDIFTDLKDSFDVKLSLTFADNCTAEVSKAINVDQLRPKVDYSYIAVECPTDNEVKLQFNFNDINTKGLGNDGLSWKIGNLSNLLNYTGNIVTTTVPKDSLISATISTTFENSCRDTVQNLFLPGPFATLDVIQDSLVLCPGETKFLIENGNPSFDYYWSPLTGLDLTQPENPKLSAVEDMIYRVTVSDGLCNVNGFVAVDVLETISLLIDGEAYSCDGKVSLTAIGGVGQGTYVWSNDPDFTNEIATGIELNTTFESQTQQYYVKFKGEVCSAIPANITVTNQKPRLDVIGPYEFCIGDTIKTNNVFNLEASHQNIITWKADPHLISGDNTYNPVVGTIASNDKNFTLYVEVSNQFGCKLDDSLAFNIIENPVVSFDYTVKSCDTFEVCFKMNGTIFGFPRWNFGDPASGNNNNSILPEVCHLYTGAGSYPVSLINLTEVCPFKDILDTIVLNSSFPVFETKRDEDCLDASYSLDLPAAAIGREFVWLDGSGKFLSTNANPVVSISADTFFILNVKDDNGCAFSDTFFVDAFRFAADITVPDTVCATGLYQINTSINSGINFEYIWSPASGIVSGSNTGNPIVDVSTSKNYRVEITHPVLGCKLNEEVNFNVFNFDYKLNLPAVFCLNQTSQPSIQVQGNAAYLYQWGPPNLVLTGGNTPNPSLNIIGEDEFFVTVIHPTLYCVLMDSFTVDPTSLILDVEAQPNTEVPKGQSVEVSVVNPVSGWTYNWSNGFTGVNQIVVINEETVFTVTATDSNGCTGDAEIRIKVRPPQCADDVFLPNAFSPNGDDKNDVLLVRSNYITEMELIVYNRWGQEVFSSKDQAVGWNGTFNGEELSPDVYAYWLRARCADGEEIIKKGNVSLLR
ncbi:MAG: gliding motility-associated C-terminal domain-containing protein [Saprospiraceae bacterium]|nr:gliding motility-associated C-terminal domain-containing protein [Saprospiraceae bacterium]